MASKSVVLVERSGHISGVQGMFKLYKDGRMTFASNLVEGADACRLVIYVKETPTIKVGEGYMVRGTNSGHALGKAPKITFPENILRLAMALKVQADKQAEAA